MKGSNAGIISGRQLALLGSTLALLLGESAAQAKWQATGEMGQVFARADAVRLLDGRVLLANQLYDPESGSWSATGPLHNSTCDGFVMALLGDGRALFVCGANYKGETSDPGLYDPATNQWTPTAPLPEPLQGVRAVSLSADEVLVTGGVGSYLTHAVIFSAKTSNWRTAAPLSEQFEYRDAWALLRLDDGRVLALDDNAMHVYDPALDSWRIGTAVATADMGAGSRLTMLQDGRVLVIGGSSAGSYYGVNFAEIYDPASESWTTLPPMAFKRSYPMAVLLENGKVLVAGGIGAGLVSSYPETELFDPATGSWHSAGRSSYPVGQEAAGVLLDSGAVLVAGGNTVKGQFNKASLFSLGANGDACADPAECASDVCSEGICCDRPCAGVCESCSRSVKASGSHGTCGPVRRGTRCGPAECNGRTLTGLLCTAEGECLDSSWDCSPFNCRNVVGESTDYCNYSCNEEKPCPPGFDCVEYSCVEEEAAAGGGGGCVLSRAAGPMGAGGGLLLLMILVRVLRVRRGAHGQERS